MRVILPDPPLEETQGTPYKFGDFLITPTVGSHYTKFSVDEITGYEFDESTNDYTKIHDLDPYLQCTIKWDSCSHFSFGDGDGYLHICGVGNFLNHVILMRHLYDQAFKLMGQAPQPGEEWPLTSEEIEVLLSKYQ